MRKCTMSIIVALAVLAAFVAGGASAESNVLVQVASTHLPTPEFQQFAEEFRVQFGALCASGEFSGEPGHRVFFLIERRDKGQWRIGLCEPILGFASAELSFNPLWVIEGANLKNQEKLRALAREAAEFLFRKVSQRRI